MERHFLSFAGFVNALRGDDNALLERALDHIDVAIKSGRHANVRIASQVAFLRRDRLNYAILVLMCTRCDDDMH